MPLWLPDSATKQQQFNCLVCGETFYEEKGWVRHVKMCAQRNDDVLDELAAMKQSDGFTSIMDKEKFMWKRARYADGRRDRETVGFD